MNNIVVSVSDLSTNILKSESIASSLGLVEDYYSGTGTHATPINVLPIRAIFACYNEFYRDENYQDQYKWNKDQTGVNTTLATLGAATITSLNLLPQVNKDNDLFTSILPWQIKGNPITLSIGNSAPVITGAVEHTTAAVDNEMKMRRTNGSVLSGDFQLYLHDSTVYYDTSKSTGSGAHPAVPTNLYADLSQATGVNLSDIIYSLAYQDFLSRSARFGTRFKEYIYSMFGTTIADASEDIPEYLGRMKFNINVQQVVQTTGFDFSSSTELGNVGAYSKSGSNGKVFTKSFTEPGYLVGLFYTKHQRTYGSGFDPVFKKFNLLNYYQPPFANIADVPILQSNLFNATGTGLSASYTPEYALGFQEPWFEYRTLQDRVYGLMNPKIDTLGQLWTLAEYYSNPVTINGAFMVEDRASIQRVLTTGVNGPDYIVDSMIYIDATRVMPLYPSSKLGLF
jgi:hypothetical protein